MIAQIGAAIWPLVKWFVPWLGPRSGLSLVIMGAAGVLSIWLYVEHREAVNAAERACDARWEQSLDRLRMQHDREIEAARDAADNAPPIPDTPDALERLCAQSPTCRDRADR